MSMNPLTPDDPRLTAYVLGELSAAERADVERQLAASPALREAADELRETTALLGAAFESEPTPSLSDSERRAIAAAALRSAPTPAKPTARRVATHSQDTPRRGVPAVMAVAAIALLAGVVLTLHESADEHERRTVSLTEAEESDESTLASATEWAEHSARGAVDLAPNAVVDESGAVLYGGRHSGRDNLGRLQSTDAQKNPQSSAPTSGPVAVTNGVTVTDSLSLSVRQRQQLYEESVTHTANPVGLGVTSGVEFESFSRSDPATNLYSDFTRTPHWYYSDTTVANLGDQQGRGVTQYGMGVGGAVPPGWGTVPLNFTERTQDRPGLATTVHDALPGAKLALSGEAKGLPAVEGVVNQLVVGKELDAKGAEVLKRELAEVAQEQAQQVQDLRKQLAEQAERLRQATEPPQGEQYLPIVENEFIEPLGQAALSTFSIDVDTASYTNMRRFLHQGQLPPPAAVRIEELLNYFHYDYPQPPDGQPFSVNTEVAPCPWNPKHRLLRFGLKGREISADQRPKSNLVFLVDTSGSMSSGDKLPLVQQGLELLAGQMGEQDRVAIVTYAGTVGTALESTPGTDRQRIVDVIRGLSSNGSTNGAGGITAAYDLAVSNFITDGTNRVILCTDGDFNVGVSDQGGLEKLIEEKRQSGVFLSVFGFGTGNIQDGKMEQLANKGNGVYAYVDSLREAKRVFVKEMTGTLYTIAKDVKLQVEFNPNKVGAYRLIGYENRVLAAQDFHDDKKDAGEIGAGHTVTALYEIIPVGLVPQDQPKVDDLKYQSNPKPLPPEATDELCTLKLRHKKPDAETSTLFRFPVKDLDEGADAEPSRELEWQAAVAGFGMVLRESKYRGHASLPLVKELAQSGIGDDKHGDRREFIDLVLRAEEIARQRAGQAPPPPVQLDEQTAREKATLGGTYTNLLQTVHAPSDFAAYGNFHEWGHWAGREWAGQENLPAGHWVYVYPNWYIWGEKGEPTPARAEKPSGK